MKHFPDFIKNDKNKAEEEKDGMEGYIIDRDNKDDLQVVFWEDQLGGEGSVHKHEFWEYFLIIQGTWEGYVGDNFIRLGPSDDYAIPPGVLHKGTHSPNYLSIDVFSSKRFKRVKNNV